MVGSYSSAENNTPVAVNRLHDNDDLDTSSKAHHHTLGFGFKQAARGSDLSAALKRIDELEAVQDIFDGKVYFADSAATTSIATSTTTQLTAGWSGGGATSMFSFSAGTWTFQQGGLYLINFTASWASSTAGRRLSEIWVNGNEVRRQDVGAGGSATVEVSHLALINANDTLQFQVVQTSGAALALNASPGHKMQVVRLGNG